MNEQFIETAHELIKMKGSCRFITCWDCPFFDQENRTCPFNKDYFTKGEINEEVVKAAHRYLHDIDILQYYEDYWNDPNCIPAEEN